MKILVIDDKAIHQTAAKETIIGHDLTVVGTYDDAVLALDGTYGRQIPSPYWDVVLIDLLMPASNETMGPEGYKFVGQEMPVGLVLALLAAKNGAKHVAVVTDTNHHHHPASAMLDRLRPRDDGPIDSRTPGGRWQPNFTINGARVLFTNYFPRYKEDGKNWGKVLALITGEEKED